MSSAPAVAEERDMLRVENRHLLLEKDELSAKNDQLVTTIDELDAKLREQNTNLRELNKKLELYEEELAWFKNKLYGRGTEQLTAAELLQIRLFDEIEQAADSEPPPDDELGLPRFGGQLIAEDSVLAEECSTRGRRAGQGTPIGGGKRGGGLRGEGRVCLVESRRGAFCRRWRE